MSTTDTPQQKRQKLISRILQLNTKNNYLDTELIRLERITKCEQKLFKSNDCANLEEKKLLKHRLMILESVRPSRVCIERNNCFYATATTSANTAVTSNEQTCDHNNTIEKCVTRETRSSRKEDKVMEIDLDLDDSSESRDDCGHQSIPNKFTDK